MTSAQGEFQSIEQYWKDWPSSQVPWVEQGIGDDAAVLTNLPPGKLLMCADSMVLGTHFTNATPVASLGYKLIASNLSDLLAMAAKPLAATLCLTLPTLNASWLEQFQLGVKQACAAFQVPLVGGDTTTGPLVLSLQLLGVSQKPWLRSGAMPGDIVFVSGTLGDARAGLALTLAQDAAEPCSLSWRDHEQQLIQTFHYPAIAFALLSDPQSLGAVSAAIDLSDGLLNDLQHLCRASEVSAEIDPLLLPISSALAQYCMQHNCNPQEQALLGGEDYQLCLCIAPEQVDRFLDYCIGVGVAMTRIGQIQPVAESAVLVTGMDPAQIQALHSQSFAHF